MRETSEKSGLPNKSSQHLVASSGGVDEGSMMRGPVFLITILSLSAGENIRNNTVSLDLLAPYPTIALPTVPHTPQ